jgi:hypothetical protein
VLQIFHLFFFHSLTFEMDKYYKLFPDLVEKIH